MGKEEFEMPYELTMLGYEFLAVCRPPEFSGPTAL